MAEKNATYHVRRTRMEDVPVLLRLAEESRQTMRQNGNMTQWSNGYPDAIVFENDIAQNNSYVVTDENHCIVATFAFIHSPEPTYAKIYEGKWIEDTKPYYVIHRIASAANSQGMMPVILNYCFQHTDNIRIDTHRDNTIMRHLMQKHGFEYCGIIYLLNGDERLAFQKIKKN